MAFQRLVTSYLVAGPQKRCQVSFGGECHTSNTVDHADLKMKDTYLTNSLLYQAQAMNTKDQSLLRAFSDSSCRRLSRSFRQWDAELYWEATVITDRLHVISKISELE